MAEIASKDLWKIAVDLNNERIEVRPGTSIAEVLKDSKSHDPELFIGAKMNNRIVDISEKLWQSSNIELLDLFSEDGMRIYRQSLVFVLGWAVYELFPNAKLEVKYSLGQSYYCEFANQDSLLNSEIENIEKRMQQLIKSNLSIYSVVLKKEEAIEYLNKYKRPDTLALIESMKWEEIRIHFSGKYADFSKSILVPRTGILKVFTLEAFNRGFLLLFPGVEDRTKPAQKYNLPQLARAWQESEEWAKILGIRNIPGLVQLYKRDHKEADNLIHIGEALQEKKIAQMADEIYQRSDKIKIILIAGPSSSGKTTFAERLAIQLRVLGLRPIAISTDDYFLNREHTPLDESGEYDFEALEAVDLNLFNKHLQMLIEGKQILCPIFDFNNGSRSENGREVASEDGHPIIIEGIHSLNEELTAAVPREKKCKIYISSLTQVAIDDHNRINTTDTRLIRRIVRDNHFRGRTALETLKFWPSVRKGEEKNIFPFQEEADMFFNSSLIFELSILKSYAYNLLNEITPAEKEYSDAEHLLRLLDYFPEISDRYVPLNSILREFIGGSSINGR